MSEKTEQEQLQDAASKAMGLDPAVKELCEDIGQTIAAYKHDKSALTEQDFMYVVTQALMLMHGEWIGRTLYMFNKRLDEVPFEDIKAELHDVSGYVLNKLRTPSKVEDHTIMPCPSND